MQYLDVVVSGIVFFLFGGGVVQFIKAGKERKLVDQQAKTLGAKTEVEVHDIAISTMVKTNEFLQHQYDLLKEEHTEVKKERDSYWGQMERMRQEMEELREQLEQTQSDLEAAHSATVHLQEQLERLMASLPQNTEPGQGNVNSRLIEEWDERHKDDPRNA